jgi:hypothetical protein
MHELGLQKKRWTFILLLSGLLIGTIRTRHALSLGPPAKGTGKSSQKTTARRNLQQHEDMRLQPRVRKTPKASLDRDRVPAEGFGANSFPAH